MVRKHSKEEDNDDNSSIISSKSISKMQVKKSKFNTWFSSKEPLEEEFTLLPVYTKEKDQIKVLNKVSSNDCSNDWWTRFFYSHEVNNYYFDWLDEVETTQCSSLSFI